MVEENFTNNATFSFEVGTKPSLIRKGRKRDFGEAMRNTFCWSPNFGIDMTVNLVWIEKMYGPAFSDSLLLKIIDFFSGLEFLQSFSLSTGVWNEC